MQCIFCFSSFFALFVVCITRCLTDHDENNADVNVSPANGTGGTGVHLNRTDASHVQSLSRRSIFFERSIVSPSPTLFTSRSFHRQEKRQERTEEEEEKKAMHCVASATSHSRLHHQSYHHPLVSHTQRDSSFLSSF